MALDAVEKLADEGLDVILQEENGIKVTPLKVLLPDCFEL